MYSSLNLDNCMQLCNHSKQGTEYSISLKNSLMLPHFSQLLIFTSKQEATDLFSVLTVLPLQKFTYMDTYSMKAFDSGLFFFFNLICSPSMSLHVSVVYFFWMLSYSSNSSNIFHYIDVPHFVYPFSSETAFGLFPWFGDHE